MSAQDFFEAFFQGGPVQRHHHQHRGRQPSPEETQRQQLLQLLPLLFLLLTALSSSTIFTQPSQRKFSWNREGAFPISRNTKRLNASYYVNKQWEKEFPVGSTARKDFEHQVEMDHVRTQQSDCEYQERQMWKRVMMARRNTDPTIRAREVEKAKAVPRKACEKLEKIKYQHPKLYRAAQGYSDADL